MTMDTKFHSATRAAFHPMGRCVLTMAVCLTLLASGVSFGQINEATTQPPPPPKPRFPQLPGDQSGDADSPARPPSKSDIESKQQEIVGRIQKIDGRRLFIKQENDANPHEVTLSKEAEITLNKKTVKLADLKVNDIVRVEVPIYDPHVAVKVIAARPTIKGPQHAPPVRNTRRPAADRDPLPARQGGLGIVVSDSPNQGILILHVHRDTPAWSAEVQSGDYLLKLGPKDIVTPDDFLSAVRSHAPSEKLTLLIWRDGKTRKGVVQLTTREAARDREAEDDRGWILGETDGEEPVEIERESDITDDLDGDQEDPTIVLDRDSDGSTVIIDRDHKLPTEYDKLAEQYRQLQDRVRQLEAEINRSKR